MTRGFPRTGYAELKSQLTRAAESIPSNIVEGCAAATAKEFARYLDISIKSTAEVEYRLQLATDNGVLAPRTWRSLTAEVVEIRRMLCGLRRSVLSADRKRQPKRENGDRRRKTDETGPIDGSRNNDDALAN